ncbi:MAG: hypothetical protein E7252_04325 [Lachnospira sp.]|nr:hypothetical protein [Lachnospira sp.]
MGSFAGIIREKGSFIPEEKKEELGLRMKELFHRSGMMHTVKFSLHGKNIYLLKDVEVEDNRIFAWYNYFEEDSWEVAGFDYKECRVYSEKVGGRYFVKAVIAAYILQELYTQGTTMVYIDNNVIKGYGYVSWINYLFNEKYHIKNYDAWKLFEMCHYEDDNIIEGDEWFDFGDKYNGFLAQLEISAVQNGYKKTLEMYDYKQDKEDSNMEKMLYNILSNSVIEMEKFKNTCPMNRDEQLNMIIDSIRNYDNIRDLIKEYKALDLGLISISIVGVNAFIVKVIAELYEVDFWDLWDKVKDIAKRSSIFEELPYYLLPLSTEKFFKKSPDDMIYYWNEGEEWNFSEDVKVWFSELKEKFDELMAADYKQENLIKYVFELLYEANCEYYGIYAFNTFFEESIDNINDKRYQVLWKMFGDMINNPELKETGKAIYKDGDKEKGLYSSWLFIEENDKNNIARATLKRYLALLANKELRAKVFGF